MTEPNDGPADDSQPDQPAAASEATTSDQAPVESRDAWSEKAHENAKRDSRTRKTLRIALAVALALHLGFLAFHFPQLLEAEPSEEEEQREVFLVKNVQVKPPEPEPQPKPEPEPEPEPEAVKIPMPDPEPQEPEPEPEPTPEPVPTPDREIDFAEEDPTREDLPTPSQTDVPDVDMDIAIPEGPPDPEPEGPIRVGGDVSAPVKISGRDPAYTPNARHARIEGPVVVQAIVNKRGVVTDIKILKDQPMGLGEQAKAAIRDWKFEPATLNGKPVDVYYNLTVHFSLD